MKKYTAEHKAKIVRDIQAEVQAGKAVKQACDERGVHFSSYYGWVKKIGAPKVQKKEHRPARKKARVEVMTLPTPPSRPGQMMFVLGSTSQVADLIRALA